MSSGVGQLRILIRLQLDACGEFLVVAEAVRIGEITSNRPRVFFNRDSHEETLECDWVAGCDGFWGISRGSIPVGAVNL